MAVTIYHLYLTNLYGADTNHWEKWKIPQRFRPNIAGSLSVTLLERRRAEFIKVHRVGGISEFRKTYNCILSWMSKAMYFPSLSRIMSISERSFLWYCLVSIHITPKAINTEKTNFSSNLFSGSVQKKLHVQMSIVETCLVSSFLIHSSHMQPLSISVNKY